MAKYLILLPSEITTLAETSTIIELVKDILSFELNNRYRYKKNAPESDEADGLSPEIKLFHSVLCILEHREFPTASIPRNCCEIIEILTTKAAVLELLRNLPEATRQHVDHSLVIPLLWVELLENYPRCRDAAKGKFDKIMV